MPLEHVMARILCEWNLFNVGNGHFAQNDGSQMNFWRVLRKMKFGSQEESWTIRPVGLMPRLVSQASSGMVGRREFWRQVLPCWNEHDIFSLLTEFSWGSQRHRTMQAHELFRYFRMPELVDLRQYVRTLPTNTLMGFGAFAALTTFWYATRPKALKPPCDLSLQSVEVAVSGGACRPAMWVFSAFPQISHWMRHRPVSVTIRYLQGHFVS